ncbi:MAG: hypothetical protein AAF525_10190 [Pseudomonadota bacterium]
MLSVSAMANLNASDLPTSLQNHYEGVQVLVMEGRLKAAADKAEDLYQEARLLLPDTDSTILKLRGYVADRHHRAGNLTFALRHYTYLVSQHSEYSFDVDLVDPLYGLARTYIDLGLEEDAEQALLRAQNITHRDDGVYTLEQVEILEDLTELNRNISAPRRDQQRRYHLRIHEDAFGKDDPNVVPSVLRLARYLDQRAVTVQSHLLMKEYRRRVYRTECHGLYERAIDLLKQAHGPADPRLIEPMREYAEVLFHHKSSRQRAYALMQEIEGILGNHPDVTPAERAKARVEVADYYNKWNDGRAVKLYREAWDMIADDPVHEIAREELFGTPVRLTHLSLAESAFPVRTRPLLAQGEDIYSEVSYTVTADGRVRSVETVGGNVTIRDANPLRLRMARIKYRPRFVDGEPVSTLGVIHTQAYHVNRYAKRRPIDHIKCTSCTDFSYAW